MEETVELIIALAFCIALIITLIIAVYCYETENSRLRRENRRLRRALEDYQRLEQASLEAHIALTCEAQRYIGG